MDLSLLVGLVLVLACAAGSEVTTNDPEVVTSTVCDSETLQELGRSLADLDAPISVQDLDHACHLAKEVSDMTGLCGGQSPPLPPVCVDETSRDGYLKHAACFKEASEMLNNCTDHLPKEAMMPERQDCCQVRKYIKCVKDMATNHCGESVLEFLDSHIVIPPHCEKFPACE